MPKESALVVGDKVDVTVDGQTFYKTTIGEVFQDGLVMMGAPIYKSAYMPLNLYDEICLIYYRDSGRYFALMRVVDFLNRDNVTYVMLEKIAEPEKDQRREHYRLPTNSIESMLCEYRNGLETALTIKEESLDVQVLADARARDISAAGIGLVTTKWACQQGEDYLLKLYFDGFKGETPPFMICAKVMRSVQSPESGFYNVGMQFFGATKDKSEYLSKFIISQQQKQILKRRLLEEN